MSVRREEGSALVLSMVVLAMMAVLAMPLLDMIDSTQRRTTTERVADTAYSVAEAGLTAQTLVLTVHWPHSMARGMPATCARASTVPQCPQASVLTQDFLASDFDAGSDWAIQVRDNTGATPTFYDRPALDATACGAPAPCTWDSNGDGVLWVRAQASIRGRVRTLVQQVRQQIVRLPVPRGVITSGWLTTTNSGLKTIVDGKGCLARSRPTDVCDGSQPAPVIVRCQTATPATTADKCLGYRPEQVAPNLYVQDPAVPSLLTPAQLDQVRTLAIQLGAYRNSCPETAAHLSGPVVFVEPVPGGAPLHCSFRANGVANSAVAPGVLVFNRATISISGTFEYYGLIYMANNLPVPASAGALLSLTGNAYVQGGVFVDGTGGVVAGSSGLNLAFDENALGSLKGVSGNASAVPNSFRELPSGQ